MGDTSDEPPSFDPRTWGKPPTPIISQDTETTTGSSGAETASFNPKSWSRPATGGAAIPPPKTASRRGLLLGGGAAGASLAGLGIWWFVGHGSVRRDAIEGRLASAQISNLQRRALVVPSPAEIGPALVGAGVPAPEAAAAAKAAVGPLVARQADLTLVMMLEPAGTANRLDSLEARYEDGAGVVVTRAAGGFSARATAADLRTVVKVVRGEMDAYSFYTSAVAQHLTDSLISPFAQALAFDFDFQREIHQGDVFEAAFEDRENPKGESVGVGRLLYVSMQTRLKSRALYWFQAVGGNGGWFDANGRSIVRALMRTPVEGARISSTFGMREHPILGFMKLHKGVDFAAPIGTPIYAAGDGGVEDAEFKELNGNYVKLRHDNGWETLYLHMSAFAPGIVVGARVRQGQQIGAIGTTGRSTGPHLHYEVHIGGRAVDPMSVQSQDAGVTLAGASLAAFFKERDRIDALRAAQTD